MKTALQIEAKIEKDEIEWFGRDKFIENLCVKLVEEEDESRHICLKGIWGSGKTTTILGMKKRLESENVLVLYLDAWKYENYQHPTYALLKAIQESDPDVYKLIKAKMEEKKLSYQAGINIPFLNFEVGKEYTKENHKIISEAEYIDQFNQILIDAIQEYKKEKGNKLIIFVDELDRAKPEFALRLLETFHHLYDDLPTHFVYSADINQLNSMIKHYYGYEYNTEIFLHKVFDEIIPLEPLSEYEMRRYFEKTLKDNKYNTDKLIELVRQHMGAGQINSLRSVNYVFDTLSKNLSDGYFKVFNDIRYVNNYYLGEDHRFLWAYVELLVILVTKSLSQPFLVQDLIVGNQSEKLGDYILDNELDTIYSLVYESFYADKETGNKSSYEDDPLFQGESRRMYFAEGVKNIFKPKVAYNNVPVFENIIL